MESSKSYDWNLYCDICGDYLTIHDLSVYLNFLCEKYNTHNEFNKSNYTKIHKLSVPILCGNHNCECMPTLPPVLWSRSCVNCKNIVCGRCYCGHVNDPYCKYCRY